MTQISSVDGQSLNIRLLSVALLELMSVFCGYIQVPFRENSGSGSLQDGGNCGFWVTYLL